LHLGYHGNGCHFEFFKPPKSCHTLRWIFLQSFMKFDERNQKFFLIPPSLFLFLPSKVCPTHFSATTERKSMKLHRNVKHYF
jgi:hypothetical protein